MKLNEQALEAAIKAAYYEEDALGKHTLDQRINSAVQAYLSALPPVDLDKIFKEIEDEIFRQVDERECGWCGGLNSDGTVIEIDGYINLSKILKAILPLIRGV